VVSEAVKFTVTRRTAKSAHSETQTHGFEVGLIGARGDRLVLATVKSFLGLATVKSFLGSRGVAVEHVTAQGGPPRFHRLYAMLNDSVVRDVVLDGACTRYGYEPEQVEFRLYVGKFTASTKPALHAGPLKSWCAGQHVTVKGSVFSLHGGGPVRPHLSSGAAPIPSNVEDHRGATMTGTGLAPVTHAAR